ncbi:hypothetical protein Q4557_06710 [Shewanella sp. 5_MG-2023]|uniref:hypothetical protein n=1 Tax=Shewanella sp. 5_MG-2023 TaxID=3062656 RepID=UPI0026E479D9|nr:hypothetical protein [Shewanella sp. 5_MG-2023]MDO6639649.1 hypothetical protein [Shewanella sp. 5_MG-2023]
MKKLQTRPFISVMALMLLSLAVSYRIDASLDWLSFTFQLIDLTVQVSDSATEAVQNDLVNAFIKLDISSVLQIVVIF